METPYEAIKRQLQERRLGSHVPVAGWFHFPLADDDPTELAKVTVCSAVENRWDFVKLMPNGNYLPVAYGADYEYSRDSQQWSGTFRSHPIASADDARKIKPLGCDNPTLAAELACARKVTESFGGRRPVIATLFDPLSWVQELSTPLDPAFCLDLIRYDPEALACALKSIHQTNRALVEGFADAGCDGVFVSTKFSQANLLSAQQHERFVMPYLREMAQWLLQRDTLWFNVLHVHGIDYLRMDDLIELEFQALNWESASSRSDADVTRIAEVRNKTDKMIIGGIDRAGDFRGGGDVVERISRRLSFALQENEGGAFAFAPGCVLPLDVDQTLFRAIAQARDSVA